MKILFLSHKFYPYIGGIEVISELLANSFTNAGHEVHLITWTPDPGDKLFNFKVTRNPDALTLFKAHSWAQVIFENNPCLKLSWPNFFYNKHSVITLHTWVKRITGEVAMIDRIKKMWLSRAQKVIAVSNAVRLSCWPEALVVGNPYRSSQFRTLNEGRRSKDFVFLGRLVSDKGADLAIKAFNSFCQKYRDEAVTLTIIGEGPELEPLKDLSLSMGSAPAIRFTGALSGEPLVAELNQHQFLLIPSIWDEPFGLVALEGLACGCIPIAANCGGLPDAVGNAGLLFKKGDLDDLLSTMEELYFNSNLLSSLQTRISPHLKAYEPEKISSRYLNELEAIAQ